MLKKCKHLNKRNEEKNTIIRTEKKYYLARVSRKYENKEIKTTTKRLVRIIVRLVIKYRRQTLARAAMENEYSSEVNIYLNKREVEVRL